MGKDPFEELDLTGQDTKPLEPAEDPMAIEIDELTLEDIRRDNLDVEARNKALPRHLRRKSLGVEIAQWQQEIITSPHPTIAYEVPSLKHAGIKRTRLYHARTLIGIRQDYDQRELDKWSLSLETYEDKHYVVCRKMERVVGQHIAHFDP